MFKVIDEKGQSIRFKFVYPAIKSHYKNKRIICVIQTKIDIDWYTIGIGCSQCHTVDEYDKGLGRRVALARALKAASLTREVRGKIWDSYFASVKDKCRNQY
jgi:hypothetical protein